LSIESRKRKRKERFKIEIDARCKNSIEYQVSSEEEIKEVASL